MLSEENKAKLCMTGLYKCKPERKYRSSIHWKDMYHCCNWTFRIEESDDGKIYMHDTYWSDNGGVIIEITDDNFDEFKFIFDFNKVKSHSGDNINDYDECDWWCVAIDSGGRYCGGKYFVKKEAEKNKDKVLARLEEEIRNAESNLENKIRDYDRVKSGELEVLHIK